MCNLLIISSPYNAQSLSEYGFSLTCMADSVLISENMGQRKLVC